MAICLHWLLLALLRSPILCRHLERIEEITQEAANCLRDTDDAHLEFFHQYRVTKFFGSRRYIKGWEPKIINQRKLTPIKPTLQAQGKNPHLDDAMETMSCADFSRKCLHQGFEKVGQEQLWQKIERFNHDKMGCGRSPTGTEKSPQCLGLSRGPLLSGTQNRTLPL